MVNEAAFLGHTPLTRQNHWESALIMGERVRFYWKRTRGTDWSTPDVLPKVERVEQAGLFNRKWQSELRLT